MFVAFLLSFPMITFGSEVKAFDKDKALEDIEDRKTDLEDYEDLYEKNKHMEVIYEGTLDDFDTLMDSIKEDKLNEEKIANELLFIDLKLLKLKDVSEMYIYQFKKNIPYEQALSVEVEDTETSTAGFAASVDTQNQTFVLQMDEEELKDKYKKEEEKKLILQQEMYEFNIIKRIEDSQTTIEVALEEMDKIIKELDNIQSEFLVTENPYRVGKYNFMWPVKTSRLSSAFGHRIHPITKQSSTHTGIDMPSPVGTPIYAADSGKITFSGWKGGYGNTVIIEHKNGYQTLYAHNSKLVVKEGQYVERGQYIAKMGSTGQSTGSHLHFEIKRGGKAINPLYFYY